jgi:hypothetical protein
VSLGTAGVGDRRGQLGDRCGDQELHHLTPLLQHAARAGGKRLGWSPRLLSFPNGRELRPVTTLIRKVLPECGPERIDLQTALTICVVADAGAALRAARDTPQITI